VGCRVRACDVAPRVVSRWWPPAVR
jgi:hypothetical protein